ncbi:unnamed protein product [Rhodiola kirilowii]
MNNNPPPVTVSSRNRKNGGSWKAAIFIIVVEVGERVAFYGVSLNLITYLTKVLAQPVAVAAKNVNLWMGVSALFPLLGGFIADSYLGRFKTILLSSLIYLIGLIMLTAAAHEGRGGEVMFFTALYLLSVGEGGHKPCIQTFAADQFDNETAEEKKTMSSFFNWWYLGIVVAAMFATLLVIYVQDNVGWTVGFGMLMGVVAAALVIFLVGLPFYRREVPVGSPFTSIAQVFVAALRKRGLSDQTCSCSSPGVSEEGPTLARTNQFRFLDKAAAADRADVAAKAVNRWRLCTINQVEETKQILRLLPIWFSGSIFFISIAQLSTFFTKQASTMVRSIGPHFQIPPASIHVTTGFVILLAIPAYDRLFVPLARRITSLPTGITVLQRIGIGIFFSIITMVLAALVEQKRVSLAKEYHLLDSPKATVPMSVWWLLPPFMVSGLADVFSYVGFQELFYDQMPENMRSIGAAGFISMQGIGNLASTAVISLVQLASSKAGEEWLVDNLNRAHLDLFYWVLAAIGVLNLGYFMWVSSGFHYKKFQHEDVASPC